METIKSEVQMDQVYLKQVAGNIMEILRSGGSVLMSWGAWEFRAVVFRDMAAVKFNVNGFVHKGDVVVTYNEGSDLYEVYCLDDNGQAVDSREGIYFDKLIEAIDRMVEKDCGDKEYDGKIEKWLEETPISNAL